MTNIEALDAILRQRPIGLAEEELGAYLASRGVLAVESLPDSPIPLGPTTLTLETATIVGKQFHALLARLARGETR